MKIYLDLDEIDSIPEAYKKDASDIMRITGINTGNFAFRHALRKLIRNIQSYEVVNWVDARIIINSKEKVDSVLVSCANWLGFSEQDEKSNKVRADIIRELNAPVTAFGLGAQSSSADLNRDWGPNTQDLAKVLSEKSVSLSVRDEYTQKMLERIGVGNSIVTGCPSNFINDEENFIETLKTRALKSLSRSAQLRKFLIGEFSGGHKSSGSVLKKSYTSCRNFPQVTSYKALTFIHFS